MISSFEYLSCNRTLASQLIGQKMQYITRLMDLEPENELRMESGPLLIQTFNGSRLYMDVDEGKANILLFDADEQNQPINYTINKIRHKQIIIGQENFPNKLAFLREQAIAKIEIISRLYESYDFYSMCGFRLTFANRQLICIGAYLTEIKIPDVWILMPDEVDINLHYQTLTSPSE